MMLMPFGKHKGHPVDQIPDDYLEWLRDNVDLRPNLAAEVGRVLWERFRAREREYDQCDESFLPAAADLKTIYRRLAMKWHPDRGGSHEAMQAVNEFYQELKVAM